MIAWLRWVLSATTVSRVLVVKKRVEPPGLEQGWLPGAGVEIGDPAYDEPPGYVVGLLLCGEHDERDLGEPTILSRGVIKRASHLQPSRGTYASTNRRSGSMCLPFRASDLVLAYRQAHHIEATGTLLRPVNSLQATMNELHSRLIFT
jgi:hypothetical protein